MTDPDPINLDSLELKKFAVLLQMWLLHMFSTKEISAYASDVVA